MKLSISTLAAPTWSFQQIADLAAASGVAGIDFRGLGKELDNTKLPEFTTGLDQTLQLLKEKQLSIPCYQTSIRLTESSPELIHLMMEDARRTVELCAKTNTPYIRVFGGKIADGMNRADAAKLGQKHLRQLIKITTGCGCKILVETHDDWAASAETMQFFDGVDPIEAGIIWDLEHPWRRGEKPLESARLLSRFIKHIHIKDTKITETGRQQMALGDGELPLVEMLTALKTIKYDGWICLEAEKRWDPTCPEPEVSVPRFAEFMRQNW